MLLYFILVCQNKYFEPPGNLQHSWTTLSARQEKSTCNILLFHLALKIFLSLSLSLASFTFFLSLLNLSLSSYRFLKWGSYPVVSVDNATFPPHMHYLDNSTISTFTTTLFEPKSATVQPVYSPEPGDWFVSAYLSPWNEKVHQKVISVFHFYSFQLFDGKAIHVTLRILLIY